MYTTSKRIELESHDCSHSLVAYSVADSVADSRIRNQKRKLEQGYDSHAKKKKTKVIFFFYSNEVPEHQRRLKYANEFLNIG